MNEKNAYEGPVLVDERMTGNVDFAPLEKVVQCRLESLYNGQETIENVAFSGCEFHKVNWEGVTLRNVAFTSCEFNKVNLSGATLEQVTFFGRYSDSLFANVNLTGATLQDVMFDRCFLKSVELAKATIQGVKLHNCPLAQVSLFDNGGNHARVFGLEVKGCSPAAIGSELDKGIFADPAQLTAAVFGPQDAKYFSHVAPPTLDKGQARAQVDLWRNLVNAAAGPDPRPSQSDCWTRARAALASALRAVEVDMSAVMLVAPGLFQDSFDLSQINAGSRALSDLLQKHETGIYLANSVKNPFNRLKV